MTFWVQNTYNFKRKHVASGKFFLNKFSYIERIVTGPGTHSPPLKSTSELDIGYILKTFKYFIDAQSKYLDVYLLALSNSQYFDWASIKNHRPLDVSKIFLFCIFEPRGMCTRSHQNLFIAWKVNGKKQTWSG